MTEEIIKECEFYLPFSEDCNEILDNNGNEIYKCSSRQDCYYKKLKQAENTVNECHKYQAELEDKIERLEQENKELKKQIESDKGLITVGGKQQYQYLQRIDELEQENKELKVKLAYYEG